MGHHSRRESFAGSTSTFRLDHEPEPTDLVWPFGKIDGLDRDDIRETAYEIFFTACRSSPGFGGRNALNYYSSNQENTDGGSGRDNSFLLLTMGQSMSNPNTMLR